MSTIGFDKPLYILPFDHRGSFQTKMFGWKGALTAEQTAEIAAAKQVIYDAFKAAVQDGVPEEKAGILVDEQFGSAILRDAAAHRYTTACSVEKSGQDEFDFQYGEELPLLYVSSVINVEFLDVARDFCVHVDFLKWLEFRGDLQVVGDVSTHHLHDGGRRSVPCIVRGRLMPLATSNQNCATNKGECKNQESLGTPHGTTSAVTIHFLTLATWSRCRSRPISQAPLDCAWLPASARKMIHRKKI